MPFGIDINNTQQRNMVLAGLLPLGVLFVYWYMFHGKRVEEITELKTHYEELDTKNTAAKITAARGGPELQKRLAVYEQHMVRLEELIPKSEEVPQLLHTMTLRAQETGVDLTSMKPESEVPGEFYTKQTYAMAVVGSYHDVGRFLSAVGSLPRIITPVQVRLERTPQTTRTGEQKLRAAFRIETYVVPRPAPPAPAVPATAGAEAPAGKPNA